MTSVVAICNRALDKIGQPPITALSDDTKAGKACNRLYADCRDEVLVGHPWNFAIRRATIAQSGTTADQEGLSTYPLPDNCLRILSVEHFGRDWRVEDGAVVIAGTGALDVRYIARVTDAGTFSPSFTAALTAWLAHELCEPMTSSETKKQSLGELYRHILAEARQTDAREGVPRELPETSWLIARH